MLLCFAGPNGSGKSTITKFFEIVGEYTNASQCKLLLEWISKVGNEDEMTTIRNFLDKLEAYLQYAVANDTGIAIEL